MFTFIWYGKAKIAKLLGIKAKGYPYLDSLLFIFSNGFAFIGEWAGKI